MTEPSWKAREPARQVVREKEDNGRENKLASDQHKTNGVGDIASLMTQGRKLSHSGMK